VDELARDAHFAARGAFVEAEHPARGRFRQLGPVLAGAAPVPRPAPLPDAAATDTDALLSAAGYTAAELAALRSEGVVA
jgi:crotonobetainyl-CoA:carnitine CoA-transferase CaiB-like acyl-CoA transferase